MVCINVFFNLVLENTVREILGNIPAVFTIPTLDYKIVDKVFNQLYTELVVILYKLNSFP